MNENALKTYVLRLHIWIYTRHGLDLAIDHITLHVLAIVLFLSWFRGSSDSTLRTPYIFYEQYDTDRPTWACLITCAKAKMTTQHTQKWYTLML